MEQVKFFAIWIGLTLVDLAFLGGIVLAFIHFFFVTLSILSFVVVVSLLLSSIDWIYRKDFSTVVGIGLMLIVITPFYPFVDHDWR